MPGIHCLVTTMAAEPAPPGGKVMHVWLLLGQWEPEESQTTKLNYDQRNPN